MTDTYTGDINRRALLWGLRALIKWGELDGVETADPHIRGEAAYSAKVTIKQIAYDVKQLEETNE